jgi:hypothetical protein
LGDPQFTGFRGQSFQVHGVDGFVYALIAAPQLQLNSRFTFLASGACPVLNDSIPSNCWSHPGSYLGEIGSRLTGFAAVEVNGQPLSVSASFSSPSLSVQYVHAFSLSVQTPSLHVTFENSDRFINQMLALQVPVLKAVSWHGLLGQTARPSASANGRHRVIGDVDEYVVLSGDVFGLEFAYSQFSSTD